MTAPLTNSRSIVRRPASLLAALALVVAAIVSPAALASADDATIGIAGGPANESGPDDRSRLSYDVQPGQTVTDRYVVRNTGTTDQQVVVFGSDAYNTNDGAYALLETGAPSTDAGSWVTFGGQASVQVGLAPSEQKVLEFTVAVPADATPGDHAAGIVVSAQGVEGQVRVDRRVATRMYVRVAGELQPNLTLSSISASQSADWNPFTGGTDITVTLHNAGNVALGADVTARVTTWFGMSASARAHEELAEMLPGSTREVTFRVPNVPRLGYLQAGVTLQPTVAAEALDPGPLALVERQASLAGMPWVALGVIVLGLGFVMLARWRRARLTRLAEEWVAYTRAEARRVADDTAAGTVANVTQ
jgi:hypothetical protein